MRSPGVPMVLLAAVSSAAALNKSSSYSAAFVQHYPVSPCGAGSCGRQTKEANINVFDGYAATAAGRGAQVIVYPEYGITGFSSYPANQWGDYADTFGSPPTSGRSVPCDNPNDYRSATSLVGLSCIAKQHKIAVVANVAEYISGGRGTLYNTAVAFDTDGAYLTKYRKMNLWGEANIQANRECSAEVFAPSFGVRFGIMICADLIYRSPVAELSAMGVTDFLVPMAWDDSMPRMLADGWGQGFAAVTGANLLVSNTCCGAGAWSGTNNLGTRHTDGVTVVTFGGGKSPAMAPAPRTSVDVMKRQGWNFVRASQGAKACSGSFCCTLASADVSGSGYVLGAIDGIDSAAGTQWGAQACALLQCNVSSPVQRTCSNRPSSLVRSFDITVEGHSSDCKLFPEVIAEGDEVVFGKDVTWSDNKMAGDVQSGLQAAFLYGRCFSRDSLPYTCPTN